MTFRYATRANLEFGNGASRQVGIHAMQYGSRAMIVTGAHSAKASGLLDEIRQNLQRAGLEVLVYDQARPNPLISVAEEGARLVREHDIDVVVALGGGSSMDLAKGICARAKAGASLASMIKAGTIVEDAVPLIAIPTTCGTGSEVNRMGVLTNDENHDKRAIKGPALVPAAALVDPAVMAGMPRPLFATVAFDAFCHLMEGYLTNRANQMSDALTREGIRLMMKSLRRAYQAPDDLEALRQVVFASSLGGYALDCVSVMAPHAISHPLGSLKDVAHGRALAAVTPAVYRSLAQECPERLGELSRMLGGTDHWDAWKMVDQLLGDIDLKVSLEDMGFTEEDLVYLTYNTVHVQSWVLAGTPGNWGPDQVQQVLRRSMHHNDA